MAAMQQLMLASGIALGGGLLGMAISTILHRRARAREAVRMADLVATGGMPAVVPSHPLSPLLAAMSQRLAMLHDANGEHDAQRRQLSADMVRLMTQADGAMRAKDRFLAAISHDLRQPLQSMDLALEQLRRDSLPAQAGSIRQLQAGMRTLTEVLDGLLLLSQFDAGALQAQAAPSELQDLFAQVLATQADAALRAGVTLHAHAGGHAVFTDPGMLASLLGRLLENAINASPAGGRVLLAARRHANGIRIEVRDRGVGIAPIHQPRVFDEFFQVGNPERDHRKGFGLGLSIVSRLAALLGTRVELRSGLHTGTCFWLVLPRASVVQRPPRAVLLDADASQRDALAAMLRSWGYAVQAEATTEAACARLGSGPGQVDAVLCVVEADDDPAWALVRSAAEQQAHAARIVLCAAPGPGLPAMAARHGAQALSSPPAPSKLRSLLAQRPMQGLRGAA
jgi:signal transduction histidine kinase